MADDPINQANFARDVAAAAAAGGGERFVGDTNYDPNSGQMPNIEEIWKMIQNMDDISNEERENIRKSLFNPQDPTSEDFLKRFTDESAAMGHSSREYMIFFVMIAIVVLVFALFGYKLYKSLTEKEQKKQEKLKSKQLKKAKKGN